MGQLVMQFTAMVSNQHCAPAVLMVDEINFLLSEIVNLKDYFIFSDSIKLL